MTSILVGKPEVKRYLRLGREGNIEKEGRGMGNEGGRSN